MDQTGVIGGEFRIEPVNNDHIVYENIPKPMYSLGRTSLYMIFDELTSSSIIARGVLIPDYVCYSVVEVISRIGIAFTHYHIGEDFLPDKDSLNEGLKDKRVVLLISYFGMTDLDETIVFIRENHKDVTIIVDDVQNYYGFGKHVYYDYCFNSLRKWFAVPDGSELKCRIENDKKCDVKAEPVYVKYKIAGNILKNHRDILDDSVSLELLQKGELMMDENYLYKCSKETYRLLRRIDINNAGEIRKTNALFLHKELDRLQIKHLYNNKMTPMFIPIIIKDRDRIREKMYCKNIFTPIHWEVVDKELQGENDLYTYELSLICDQRYNEEDMCRIIREIEENYHG